MTYEQFVNKGTEHYMDMVRLIEIKTKYRMSLSTEEKIINDYIMQFQQNVKLNELRDQFEKCWGIDNTDQVM